MSVVAVGGGQDLEIREPPLPPAARSGPVGPDRSIPVPLGFLLSPVQDDKTSTKCLNGSVSGTDAGMSQMPGVCAPSTVHAQQHAIWHQIPNIHFG